MTEEYQASRSQKNWRPDLSLISYETLGEKKGNENICVAYAMGRLCAKHFLQIFFSPLIPLPRSYFYPCFKSQESKIQGVGVFHPSYT